ncbi:MAG: DUF6660 family protein [Bacteroidota bacterium]|nr:hypothetical protein [Bacteroidia bacterium]HRB52516.1 hypothetical protein [Bacteroidia bacterium]
MKIAAYIFSIYFLALSVMPCTDNDALDIFSDLRHSSQSTSANDDHNHEAETCSPFCICACCGHTAATQFTFLYFTTCTAVSNVQFNPYKILLSTESYIGIWQPPKIS